MAKTVDIVAKIVEPVVKEQGLVLWDVEFVSEGGNWVLRIVIDSPEGISTQHCEAVSRAIDPLLDEADPIEQSYILEVTSAGLGRTLKKEKHFLNFIGQEVEVRLYAPLNGSKEIFGTLVDFKDNTLVLNDNRTFSMKDVALVKHNYTF